MPMPDGAEPPRAAPPGSGRGPRRGATQEALPVDDGAGAEPADLVAEPVEPAPMAPTRRPRPRPSWPRPSRPRRRLGAHRAGGAHRGPCVVAWDADDEPTVTATDHVPGMTPGQPGRPPQPGAQPGRRQQVAEGEGSEPPSPAPGP